MRVLVTGHLGYIGSVLVPVLQAAGHDVVGLDTDLYRGCTFGDPNRLPSIPQLGEPFLNTYPDKSNLLSPSIRCVAIVSSARV